MPPSSGKICQFAVAENFEIWKCARKNKRVCARASHVKEKSRLSPPGARVPKFWIKRISSRLRPALITATWMSSSWSSIPAKWAGTGRATFFNYWTNQSWYVRFFIFPCSPRAIMALVLTKRREWKNGKNEKPFLAKFACKINHGPFRYK